jgi:hypothetical protein
MQFNWLCVGTRHRGYIQVLVVGNGSFHFSAGPRHLERVIEVFAVGPPFHQASLRITFSKQEHMPFFPTVLRRVWREGVYLVLSFYRFTHVASCGFPT